MHIRSVTSIAVAMREEAELEAGASYVIVDRTLCSY